MIGFIAPFQILDYLDRLNVVKETSREYHCTCPVCGDGGFKIEKKSGKYNAFKCRCEVKDIREAVRPWKEVRGERRDCDRHYSSTKSTRKISLARLSQSAEDTPELESSQIPEWLVKQGVPTEAVETRYWYSKTQWVSRFEWQSPSGKEKRSEAVLGVSPMSHRFKKTIRQGHIKSNGLIQWKKGGKDWKAYKLSEAANHCQDKWVLGVEGEGCVETARKMAIAAITWQGSNWKEKAIISDLTKLKNSGAAGLIYFPDNDEAGMKKAELVKSACQQLDIPCLIISPTDVWSKMFNKGDITDFLEAHFNLSTNELVSRLEKAIAVAAKVQEQERIERLEADRLANLPNWSQSDIAQWLANKYRGKLAWNTDLQEWYRYSSITEGIWSTEPVEFVGRLVNRELEELAEFIAQTSKNKKKPSYTISMINGAIALLKMKLAIRKWNEAEGLLPLQNGVLDLETRELLSHSPENKLTWCLPYEYNPLASCQPIQEWLLTMCNGDRDLVQLMRAYLLGIVTGRTDWQKYLELVGAGGTGKSTFTRAAMALVGMENVHTTTLKKLEKEKFETASIAGKRLVLINDSERYAGEVGKLKNLTGQDTLPYEVKFKQSKGGFTPSALVIVTTNEVIQSCDYTSGLARRRISIPMFNQIKSDRQKNLIEHKNGKMYGDFLPYIPGLLNWVLSMDEESATSIVKNYEANVPSLLAMKARTLVETNPIADWLNTCIVYSSSAQTNVGVAKRDKESNSPSWYLDTEKWLYPNYCEYCHNSGTRPVSLRRFVTLLSDLGKNQLGLDIRKERDRFGSYFVGLKIRDVNDREPLLITGNTKVVINASPKLENTNVINRLWTVVMDKVTDMMDYVMGETIDSDECDGCDGKNERSSELENSVESNVDCNTVIKNEKKKRKINNKFSQMPSHSSQDRTQTHTEHLVEDNHFVITIGDRVTVEDCPAYWSWASPFTVEAIDGEMVKLEMVGELVEINKLSHFEVNNQN